MENIKKLAKAGVEPATTTLQAKQKPTEAISLLATNKLYSNLFLMSNLL